MEDILFSVISVPHIFCPDDIYFTQMFHPENHNQWLARPHSWKIRDASRCIGTGTPGCDQGKGDTTYLDVDIWDVSGVDIFW